MAIRCVDCAHDQHEETCECCQNWEHCTKCKQPMEEDMGCGCCECHGEFPCPGDPPVMAHTSGQTPWEKRGETLPPNLKYTDWRAAWPVLAATHASIDVCMVAADFYVLDALRNRLINREHECVPPCRHFEFWRTDLRLVAADAEQRFWSLCQLLDRVFAEYVEMACGGELRHHNACGGRALNMNRRRAWADWKWIHEQIGPQALLDAEALFAEFGGGAFGGARWGKAARLLYDRVTNVISPLTWVDQVFTLVHNGGVFLNKLEWATENSMNWGLGYLQNRVLPAQQQDGWSILLRVGSPTTRRLWDEYWVASNKARVSMAMRPTVNLRRHVRRRLICVGCHANPTVGHTLQCRYFINGDLRNGKRPETLSINEEEWINYSWAAWNVPTLPVRPDGQVVMLDWVGYLVRIEIHTSDAVKIKDLRMNGSDLINYTMRFARNIPKVVGWPENADTEYWFRLLLMDTNAKVALGVFESRRTTNRKSFIQKYLTFGHILPLVMPHIDWSHLIKEAL